MCNKKVESVQHLFITCEFAWQVWCAWISHVGRVWSIPRTIKEHFEARRMMPMRRDQRKIWLVGFFSVIWNVWLCRNEHIFHNKATTALDCVVRSFCCSKKWCEN
ncbi:uncharacterized protein DS421_10g287510 [Arachis hypogaea]|nr:uncharacterized protein DS421_10g287510 [Arachis hypogaea]